MAIPRGRWVSKAKKYDTKREFPKGWGLNLKNFPWEGYGYFLEQHNNCSLLILDVLFSISRTNSHNYFPNYGYI